MNLPPEFDVTQISETRDVIFTAHAETNHRKAHRICERHAQ